MADKPPERGSVDAEIGKPMTDVRDRILGGRLLILAPHMDDEALACGGTVLLHRNKASIQVLFATDGAASPAPLLPWLGRTDPALAMQRRKEARNTAARLGVPLGNLTFLELPDGGLGAHRKALESSLAAAMSSIRPDFVMAPFRYDVHPDHVILNRATRAVLGAQPRPPALLEYFVYHRLRGVPGGDVRSTLLKSDLLDFDITPVAKDKRAALECYVSQVTTLYPWQDRPILTEESLLKRCAEPEYFLLTDPAAGLDSGFAAHARRVRLASLAMRIGKRPKDQAVAFFRWALGH